MFTINVPIFNIIRHIKVEEGLTIKISEEEDSYSDKFKGVKDEINSNIV